MAVFYLWKRGLERLIMDLKTIDPEPLISDPWTLKPLILWLLNCNLCFAIQFLDSYFGNKQVLAVSLIAYRTALGHQSNFAAPLPHNRWWFFLSQTTWKIWQKCWNNPNLTPKSSDQKDFFHNLVVFFKSNNCGVESEGGAN